MSQLKVNAIRHTGASSDAVTLASDGTCTVKATNRLDERNLLLNPEMRIDQRNNGSTYAMNPSAGNPTYGIVDRWMFQNYAGEAARYDVTRVTDVPANQGFTNSLKIDVTTAMGTPATQNYSSLCQFIEAQDAVYLNQGNANAKTLSLSFWIKSTKTGTSSVCLCREDANRDYVAEYTISSADTWEKKTITIPGDTTGTACANDNGRGFLLLFPFFAGSGRHQSVGSWAARPGGWYGASANQVNLVDNTSNNIFITGVSLTATDYFPEFHHRSYGDELQRCMRYYQQFPQKPTGDNYTPLVTSMVAAEGAGGNEGYWAVDFRPVLRKPPTFSHTGNFRVNGHGTSNVAVTAMGVYHNGVSSSFCYVRTSGGYTGGTPCVVSTNNDATACVKFDSEL